MYQHIVLTVLFTVAAVVVDTELASLTKQCAEYYMRGAA
jgi:hypothetical protein